MSARRDPRAKQYLHLEGDGHMRLHPHVELVPLDGHMVMVHELGHDVYGPDSSWVGEDGQEHFVLPQLLKLHGDEPKKPPSKRARGAMAARGVVLP